MQTLKRHKRDEHAIQTQSTSPLLKKKKIVSKDKNNQSEEMDIDESHDSLKDLKGPCHQKLSSSMLKRHFLMIKGKRKLDFS